jgi:hypothetical protein
VQRDPTTRTARGDGDARAAEAAAAAAAARGGDIAARVVVISRGRPSRGARVCDDDARSSPPRG